MISSPSPQPTEPSTTPAQSASVSNADDPRTLSSGVQDDLWYLMDWGIVELADDVEASSLWPYSTVQRPVSDMEVRMYRKLKGIGVLSMLISSCGTVSKAPAFQILTRPNTAHPRSVKVVHPLVIVSDSPGEKFAFSGSSGSGIFTEREDPVGIVQGGPKVSCRFLTFGIGLDVVLRRVKHVRGLPSGTLKILQDD